MAVENDELIVQEINRLGAIAKENKNLSVQTYYKPKFGYILQVEIKKPIAAILKEVHKIFGSIIYDETRILCDIVEDLSIYMRSGQRSLKIDNNNIRQGSFSICINEDSGSTFLYYSIEEIGGVNTKVAGEIVEKILQSVQARDKQKHAK